jgi:hypothetical protein
MEVNHTEVALPADEAELRRLRQELADASSCLRALLLRIGYGRERFIQERAGCPPIVANPFGNGLTELPESLARLGRLTSYFSTHDRVQLEVTMIEIGDNLRKGGLPPNSPAKPLSSRIADLTKIIKGLESFVPPLEGLERRVVAAIDAISSRGQAKSAAKSPSKRGPKAKHDPKKDARLVADKKASGLTAEEFSRQRRIDIKEYEGARKRVAAAKAPKKPKKQAQLNPRQGV